MRINASNEASTNYPFKYTTALLEENRRMLNIESCFGNTVHISYPDAHEFRSPWEA
ncbi:uncharacterized protein BDCG_17045 [Blastomyces dermatitidis ER-3]|uniref:Uncharacterized protein n=1 Tax=Ajellomyces dermatitidis (strain ER-3 / ATCC MYA-2586) TaxID=559297 RepID=A0ABX2VW17_AJEDR|nr:uncharacterized protein BDCG_17045 [Blastomyces dermatitidis ER-3]OAT01345.1 hypothetical protein BDCG_17045 [Blastomyces dermatitidis ER-3]